MSEKEKNKNKLFKKTVLSYYKKQGRRSLPWRKTADPYKITVSELMLQQTQVSRVIPKYNAFIKKFSTVDALAKASTAQVLTAWSGLGYNRRAKYLHALAKKVTSDYKGNFPRSIDELKKLPGVGPYTAGAIVVFAYDMPVEIIETNIRTTYIDYFFSKRETLVSDKELLPYISTTLDKKNPRQWYWALMDYGTFLKGKGNITHRKSAQYKKQSAFKGSRRQIRGKVLRLLAATPLTSAGLCKQLDGVSKELLLSALSDLSNEKMIEKQSRMYRLAGS